MDDLFPNPDPLLPAPPPWWSAWLVALSLLGLAALVWLFVRWLRRPRAATAGPPPDLLAAAEVSLAAAVFERTQSAAARAAAAIRAYLDSHGFGGARSRTAAEMHRWRAARGHSEWLDLLARCETLACAPDAPEADWAALAAPAPTSDPEKTTNQEGRHGQSL